MCLNGVVNVQDGGVPVTAVRPELPRVGSQYDYLCPRSGPNFGATRCLAVAKGIIWSWVPVGLPSLAIRPMANAGGVPKFLRWGARSAPYRVLGGFLCL